MSFYLLRYTEQRDGNGSARTNRFEIIVFFCPPGMLWLTLFSNKSQHNSNDIEISYRENHEPGIDLNPTEPWKCFGLTYSYSYENKNMVNNEKSNHSSLGSPREIDSVYATQARQSKYAETSETQSSRHSTYPEHPGTSILKRNQKVR